MLHLFPAGLGRANPPPPTLGPKASKARLILSFPSSSPALGEIAPGPGEAGKGICVADFTG